MSFKIDNQSFVLRPYQPSHRSFVISTWVRSSWDLSRNVMKYDTFMAHEPKLAEKMVHLATCITFEDDPDALAGWVVGDKKFLQYAYVSRGLRGKGLGRWAIQQVCGKYLEYTRRLPFQPEHTWTYNPYRLFESVVK